MGAARTQARLSNFMERGVREKVFPGGVLMVLVNGKTLHQSAHGKCSLHPPGRRVQISTCFDLASLTKILTTTVLVADQIQQGHLRLSDPACGHLAGFVGQGRENITINHLLDHSSGLAAWRSYYQELAAASGGTLLRTFAGRKAIRSMVAAEIPEARPGRRALYSDLGFILLDWILELATKTPLDTLFSEKVRKIRGRGKLLFIDLKRETRASSRGNHFAATERCPWRGRTLVGEVSDDNAYAMGGVSGHSGLFGNALGVAEMATAWLDSYRGRAKFFERDLVKRFWRRSALPGSTRALGFDTPSPKGSTAGRRFGPRSVGHTGFTGTSLWIDPERELIVVLLTNRVHPSRDNRAIRGFRPELHNLVVEVIEAGRI
jgi:CubicO group peptidase (beta-lactamase class C family)